MAALYPVESTFKDCYLSHQGFRLSEISPVTQIASSNQIYNQNFIFLSTYVNLIEAGSFTILADIANIVFPKS